MAAPFDPAREVKAEPRLVAEAGAVGDLEVVAQVRHATLVAGQGRGHRAAVAVGRVEREVRTVEADLDEPRAQRNPFQDLRERVGVDAHLRRRRVDVDRAPDRDHAEVIGAGESRDDDHDAER
jgi:hypothetical protein